jgi:uncharacterized membrane protein YfcA
MNPFYVLSGFVVGALVGLTGVGGGSLMTPLLVLAFGIHPAAAVGTDLLYAAATKGVGTVVHGRRGTVDWRITRLLATGSVPATAATLYGLSRLGVTGQAGSRVICVVLGIGLMLTAVALVFRRRIQGFAAARVGTLRPRQRDALTVLTGATLGVLVSLSSVGAGAIGVTVLILLYPELPTVRVVGSDIAHAVPLTLVAGLGHWMLGSVDWVLLGSLLAGSLPGIFVGSNIAARLPDRVLRPVLAATLALVGTRLVIA